MAALALFMLETAISGPIKPRIIAQGFGLGQWVILIMITISPTFLALEYKNNTIITLFYKNSNKKNLSLRAERSFGRGQIFLDNYL